MSEPYKEAPSFIDLVNQSSLAGSPLGDCDGCGRSLTLADGTKSRGKRSTQRSSCADCRTGGIPARDRKLASRKRLAEKEKILGHIGTGES